MLAEVISSEWIRPLSLSTPIWIYRYAGFWLHAEVPLVHLLGLVHLRTPLPLPILSGTGGCDQDGINDRALLHGHAVCFEVPIHHLKDLLAEIVILQ